jgi:homoserine dehydrogenase
VVKLLADNAHAIEARLGARPVVRAIAVRDRDKPRRVDVDRGRLTTDLAAVIDRDDVDIVCELIGGDTDALVAARRAFGRGKHLVTANKALLALHGEELFAAAEAARVDLYYEAAVCGGVPIIRALREGLASDRVEALLGILNGTSNYILTAMAEERRGFAEVLADAQALGYAEADPTLDVGGHDAVHKLCILIMLAFGARVAPEAVLVEGIDRLHPVDFEYAERFGYVIKPLAIARAHPDGLEARVHPALIPRRWLLAAVPGAKNALHVDSYALGPSMYYGAGAGMMPTAMAVVSDVIEVCRNIQAGAAGALPLRLAPWAAEPGGKSAPGERGPARSPLRDPAALESRYYLRFGVVDRPGVLGQLTTILGAHAISIAQVVQEGPVADRPVRVVVVSHRAREGDVVRALADIARLEAVVEPTALIRIAE